MTLAISESPRNSIASDAPTDEAVIKQILAGNTDKYEIIMRRYNQRLYRAAYSILKDADSAQDAVQQAYISAFYKLSSYSSIASLGAWLTKIAINEALIIKRKSRHTGTFEYQSTVTQDIEDTKYDPDTIQTNKELAILIELAINKLPDEFRTVFILRDIQKLSIEETAMSLNLNKSTVKTRLHRARKIMQERLNKQFEQAGLHVFEFAGQRCNNIVSTVLNNIFAAMGVNFKNESVH